MALPYTRSITICTGCDEQSGGFRVVFGGHRVGEALGGDHDDGFSGLPGALLLLVIAALQPSPAQRARLECGAVLLAFKLVGKLFFDKTSRSNF